MSPEQASGKVREIGQLSDIYSLGAILYAAISGRPPFRAETILDTINQILENEPVSPRTLSPVMPKDLETICLKCLAKKPEQRYQTAGELAADLRRFLDGGAIQAKPLSLSRRAVRWARRYPGFTIVFVPLTILYIYHLIVVFVLARGSSADPFFHWYATGNAVVWIAGAWFFQQLMLRTRKQLLVGCAWTTMDVLLLTAYLFVASRDAISPFYVAYFTIVAASAIRFRRGVEVYTTIICVFAFLLFLWQGNPSDPLEYPGSLYFAFPVVVEMMVIGLIVSLLLRRIGRAGRLNLLED